MSVFDDIPERLLSFDSTAIGKHLRVAGIAVAAVLAAAEILSYPYTAQKSVNDAARRFATSAMAGSDCHIGAADNQTVSYTSSGLFGSFPQSGSVTFSVKPFKPEIDPVSGRAIKAAYVLGATDARETDNGYMNIFVPALGFFNPVGKNFKDVTYTPAPACKHRLKLILTNAAGPAG